MKFLIDAQLPDGLTEIFHQKNLQAIHVKEVDLLKAKDSEIWDYALENDYIIISKDEDFAQRIILNKKGPTIIWLEKQFSLIIRSIEQSEKLIEII